MCTIRFIKNIHNMYKSLGGWTFAFTDYYNINITKYTDSVELFALQEIEDPAGLNRKKN